MTLQVTNVTGGYNQLPVLKNIDFTIGDGELVGLIGLNGAGKSTTQSNTANKSGIFPKPHLYMKN